MMNMNECSPVAHGGSQPGTFHTSINPPEADYWRGDVFLDGFPWVRCQDRAGGTVTNHTARCRQTEQTHI